jgi:hypothetical protein
MHIGLKRDFELKPGPNKGKQSYYWTNGKIDAGYGTNLTH